MATKAPWRLEFRSSEGFIVAVICMALFTDTFVYGMIIPVVPYALVDRLGVSQNDAQKWISVLLAAYGAALIVGSPLFGYFADRNGSRKIPFVLGLVAIAASTFLFVVGRSPNVLLVARVLQGLSGAAVGVVGLTFIADTVDQDRIAQAMAYSSIALTWGMLFGPVIGGVMLDKTGYYGAFAVPIALIAVDIVLRLLVIEKKDAAKWLQKRQEDKVTGDPKQETYETFKDNGSNGLIIVPSSSRSPSPTNKTVGEHSPLLSRSSDSFEQQSHDRAVAWRLLVHPRLLAALLAVTTASSILASLETTLPLFVMQNFHWSSTGAGLIFLALSLPSLLGVLVGMAADRFGPRLLATSGLLLAVGPMIALRCVTSDSTEHQVLLASLMFIIGLSTMSVEVITMAEVSIAVHEVEEREAIKVDQNSGMAQGYALCNMAYAAGQFIGPVLGGFSKASTGWSGMTLILGLICFVVAIPSFFFIGGWIGGKKEKGKQKQVVDGIPEEC